MTRGSLKILGATVAAVAVVALSTGPASARDVSQGYDRAFHDYTATEFTICDGENDSHAVWAGYYDNTSNNYKSAPVIYGSDTSGVDCTTYFTYTLTNLRVVEDNPNSSTNYYGSWHGYPLVNN